MSKKITYIILGVLVATGLIWAFLSDAGKILSVISSDDALSPLYLNYNIYVPGDKSTCNWTWTQDNRAQMFTTKEDVPNAKHTFMYPKDNTNFRDPQVKCLSDNGTTYTGHFSD